MGALGTVGAFWGPLRGLLVALKALFGGLEVLFGDPRWPLRVWRHLLGNPRDLLEGSPGAFLGGLEMSLLDITALCFLPQASDRALKVPAASFICFWCGMRPL